MTFRACILAVKHAAQFDFSLKVLDFSFVNLNAKPALEEEILLFTKNLDDNKYDLYYYTIKKIISKPIYKNFDFSKYLKKQPYVNKGFLEYFYHKNNEKIRSCIFLNN